MYISRLVFIRYSEFPHNNMLILIVLSVESCTISLCALAVMEGINRVAMEALPQDLVEHKTLAVDGFLIL